MKKLVARVGLFSLLVALGAQTVLSGEVDEQNRPLNAGPPIDQTIAAEPVRQGASIPVDENNVPLDAPPPEPLYDGPTDERNNPLDSAPGASTSPKVPRKVDGEPAQSFEAVETDVIIFPATGDTRVLMFGNDFFWNLGDYVEGVRTFAADANRADMVLSVNNGLSCDTQDHALMVDGVTVGTFSILPEENPVVRSFAFPAVGEGQHTIRIETTRTVNGGCGSAGFPDDISTLAFEVAPVDQFVFPATGDTRFNPLSGGSFWHQGDYLEGVRNLTEPSDHVEIILTVSPNGLGCDTQDHALMIDGVTVGLFSVNPGVGQVIRSFKFPLIAAGPHTFRIETTRTVNGGCGAAGFPDDVSPLRLAFIPGDKFTFPATGDTRTGNFFWVQGNYVEGIRTFTEPAAEVDMLLFIENNGLTCDTQDHALMIDGAVIGNFSVNPSDTQVVASFAFPPITSGQHTIRIETTRTVTSLCGAAGFPNDVSMLWFQPPQGEPGVVPPTISVEELSPSQIRIRWEAAGCGGADDYGIYEGTLGSWYSHTPVPGNCTDSSPLYQADVTYSPGNTYYLVVPQSGVTEGSYGTDSNLVERPALAGACEPVQNLSCGSLAFDDTYDSVGNVGIDVPPAAGVLVNDAPGLTILFYDAVSAGGGSVALADDGGFNYDPAPGFSGTDTFTYTVDIGGGATESATVFVNVSIPVWFIDNGGVGGNLGTVFDPFLSLGAFESVNGLGGPNDPEAGDCIVVHSGSGDYTGGVTLQTGQFLVGQGAGDSIANICGLNPLPPHGHALPGTGGPRPILTNVAGHGIALAQNHVVRGLNVTNTSLAGIFGNFGSLTVREMLITGQGQALSLANGTLDAVFDVLEATNTGPGPGISLDNVGGSLTVTNRTLVDETGGPVGGNGIDVQNSGGATFDFGSTTVQKLLTSGDGVNLGNSIGAVFLFDDLNLLTGNGRGLRAQSSGNVTVIAAGNGINANGGSALEVLGTTIDVDFANLASTGGAAGMAFQDAAGVVTVTGLTDVNGATGTAISVVNSPGLDLALSSIDIDGAGGNGIEIAGGVVGFDVAVSTRVDGTTGRGILVTGSPNDNFDFAAVELGLFAPVGSGLEATGNAGALFNFDALDVATSAGAGLLLSDSGTVTIGGIPAIDAAGGAAVDVSNTVGFVAGTGTWTLAGMVSTNSPGNGVRFDSIGQDVFLSDTFVFDSSTSGIELTDLSGTATMTRGSITFPGGANDSDGVRADNVGTLIIQGQVGTPFVVDGAGSGGGADAGHGIHARFCDFVSIDRVDIDNISDIGGAVLESGIYLEDISLEATVTNSSVRHVIGGDAVFVENCRNAGDVCDQFDPRSLSTILEVVVTSNTLEGLGTNLTATTSNGVRVEYETASGGQLRATVSGNTIDNLNQGIGVTLRGNGGTGFSRHDIRIGDPSGANVITDFRNDGMDLSFEDSTVSKWVIENNFVDAHVNHPGVPGTDVARDLGINWEVGGTATGTSGTADLFILGNAVFDNADEGIRVRGFADPITATVNMRLEGDLVQNNGDEFRVEVADGGTFNVTALYNTVTGNDAGGADFLFGHRNIITGTPTLRVRLFDNDADGYEFERVSTAVLEVGCTLSGAPACPLGATTSGATIGSVLTKMGNTSFGGFPLVTATGGSGVYVIIDQSLIPTPTP